MMTDFLGDKTQRIGVKPLETQASSNQWRISDPHVAHWNGKRGGVLQ